MTVTGTAPLTFPSECSGRREVAATEQLSHRATWSDSNSVRAFSTPLSRRGVCPAARRMSAGPGSLTPSSGAGVGKAFIGCSGVSWEVECVVGPPPVFLYFYL